MAFNFLKRFLPKGKYHGSDLPDVDSTKEMTRRGFLKLVGLSGVSAALASFPFELLAKNDDVIIVIVKSSEPHRRNLGAIVQHYCNTSTFLRFYGVTDINEAYQKLAKFNGLKKPSLVRNGQKIMIPKVILKRKITKVVNNKKKTDTTNFKNKGFQSPFGGKKLPVLHRCSQESPQNYSRKNGQHYTCPFDLYGANRGSRRHKGHDFYAKVGTPLYPILPGVVIKTGWWMKWNGKAVKVKSGDYVHLYLHMSKIKVKVGQQVNFNTKLGLSGLTANPYKTNPHLHLHLYYKGRVVNPIKFLGFMNR